MTPPPPRTTQIRKAEEELRVWAERQAMPDDLELPFEPTKVPPAPTPFEWIPANSVLLERWRDSGDEANMLADASGDVLSLLEFMQYFRDYFTDAADGGAGVPPITLKTLQTVLFCDGDAALQTAFDIHLAMMRPLMTEDRQNKVTLMQSIYT